MNNFHPRNKHQGVYDFDSLTSVCVELKAYLFLNGYGHVTLDFSDYQAIKTLNKALLSHYYGIFNWDIPTGYLCPPIPGRADYVHYVADILATSNDGKVPSGKKVKCLDIGVGANCIYPILGLSEYGWQFVGADIDPLAVKASRAIVDFNKTLRSQIDIRLQPDRSCFFKGVIRKGEKFDVSFCNPPFYTSAGEAEAANKKKTRNLGIKLADRNFGGHSNELWCPGGELSFILAMIKESIDFSESCIWFTTLVSKKEALFHIKKALVRAKVKQFKIVEMTQGQKVSRLVAWTFLEEAS
jgi:23S rRNA (adenine1618-N6)-methyltransferase